MEIISMTHVELARLVALQRLEAGAITQAEIATQLGLSVRQVKRLWRAYRLAGPIGVLSRRRGRPSNHRLPPDRIALAIELVQQRYPDFGPTFAAEQLAQRHGIAIGRETLRKAMIAANVWVADSHRRRRRAHPPRSRRPCRGELVQGDGSPHAWFEDRGPRCSLLIFVDDADSTIGAARFEPAETTAGYFQLTKTYIEKYGRPLAFYVDRLGVFVTSKASESHDCTQFARAMNELGVELICASSPQAKGRVERANRTLQDRLVKELRLRGINTIEAANAFLPAFIMRYNTQFGVTPRSDQDAHRSAGGFDLDAILCHCETRALSKNLTFRFKGDLYAIDAPNTRRRLAFKRVLVRQHPDRLIVEYDGSRLDFQRIELQQRAVADTKEINPLIETIRRDPRRPDPQKQRTPATNHPWRRYAAITPAASS